MLKFCIAIITLNSESNKEAIKTAGKVQIFSKFKHLVALIETQRAVMAEEVMTWNFFSLVGRAYKGLPQQAEVPQGVPGRLRPRIFFTFGTTRVVGRQPYVPGRLYPKRNP
jgi:hypothetical protein